MNKTLKQFITEYNTDKGWSVDQEGLYETFEECFQVVAKTWEDKHRWYTRKGVVRKVVIGSVERFFEDEIWFCHNEDSSAEDCGWECPDLDDIVEVFPKEVTTIVYVTQDKL